MSDYDDPDEYEVEVPCGRTIVGEVDALDHEDGCAECMAGRHW